MICPVCGNSQFSSLLDLGTSPLANNLENSEIESVNAMRFPLELVFCKSCFFTRLGSLVPAESMFLHYSYITGISQETRAHFKNLALSVASNTGYPDKLGFVVDIGSNDGTLLSFFKEMGYRVLGVEPAENISEIANSKGIETWNAFLQLDIVRSITENYGYADIITLTNVVTHVERPDLLIRDVSELLDPMGTIVVEFYYFPKLMSNIAFDQIYHEHVSYFNLTTFSAMVTRLGLQVNDVQIVDSQGGSLRVFLSKNGVKPVEPSVNQVLAKEKEQVPIERSYTIFSEEVKNKRAKIVAFLENLKESKSSIVGYGASAKATTLLNYCHIDSEIIGAVVDANEIKQNKFIPGTDIQVISPSTLSMIHPTYMIFFAWNIVDEIRNSVNKFVDPSCRFFVLTPEVREVA